MKAYANWIPSREFSCSQSNVQLLKLLMLLREAFGPAAADIGKQFNYGAASHSARILREYKLFAGVA